MPPEMLTTTLKTRAKRHRSGRAQHEQVRVAKEARPERAQKPCRAILLQLPHQTTARFVLLSFLFPSPVAVTRAFFFFSPRRPAEVAATDPHRISLLCFPRNRPANTPRNSSNSSHYRTSAHIFAKQCLASRHAPTDMALSLGRYSSPILCIDVYTHER